MSKTDTINRAVQIYAWALRQESKGLQIHVYDPHTGSYNEITGLDGIR